MIRMVDANGVEQELADYYYGEYRAPSNVIYGNGAGSEKLYDKLGRVESALHSNYEEVLQYLRFRRNYAGNLVLQDDAPGSNRDETFTYTDMGQLETHTIDDLVTTYTYDEAGNRQTVTRSDQSGYGNFSYSSQRAHRLVSVNNQLAADGTYQSYWLRHDAAGKITRKKFADDNRKIYYDYDGEGRMTGVRKKPDGGSYEDLADYVYDDGGNRLKKTEYLDDGTTRTTYYLTPAFEVTMPGDEAQTEVHTINVNSPYGMVASFNREGSGADFAAAVASRSNAMSGGLYSGEILGGMAGRFQAQLKALLFSPNLVRYVHYSLIFTIIALLLATFMLSEAQFASRRVFNRLSAHVSMGGKKRKELNSIRFHQRRLHGFGWRMAMWAVLFCFCLSTQTADAQLLPGDNGRGVPVEETTTYYHQDHVTSNTLTTDENANQKAFIVYRPFGEIDMERSTGIDDFRAKFTGKELDDTGLYYFGSRYYDSQIGRFLTPDPERQFDSPYIYGNNAPEDGIDPDGEFYVTFVTGVLFGLVSAYFAVSAYYGSFTNWTGKSAGKAAGIFIGAFFLGAGYCWLVPALSTITTALAIKIVAAASGTLVSALQTGLNILAYIAINALYITLNDYLMLGFSAKDVYGHTLPVIATFSVVLGWTTFAITPKEPKILVIFS